MMNTAFRVPESGFRVPSPVGTAVLTSGGLAGLATVYLVFTDAGLAAPMVLTVSFLWITAGVVGMVYAKPASVHELSRWVARACGIIYGLCLAWLGGLVTPARTVTAEAGLVLLSPWWGPAVSYATPVATGVVFPHRLLGYAALAHLVCTAVTRVAAAGWEPMGACRESAGSDLLCRLCSTGCNIHARPDGGG